MQSAKSRWRTSREEYSRERSGTRRRGRAGSLFHVLGMSHSNACRGNSRDSILEFRPSPDSYDLSMQQLLGCRRGNHEDGAQFRGCGRNTELLRFHGAPTFHQRCGEHAQRSPRGSAKVIEHDSRCNIERKGSIRSVDATRAAAILVGFFWIASFRLEAQQVTVLPSRASRGSIVRIAVDEPSTAGITGELGGEPLHFRRVSSNQWHALGGVPVSASGNLIGHVIVNRSAGPADTLAITVVLPKPSPPGRARPRRLSVSPRFTRPLDSATEARVAHENELARDIGRRSHDSPRMWTLPFLRPRPSRITARFGSGRSFNRVLASTHLGVDFAGKLGAPVYAANRGVVALVANFFLAGNVVYIDHGAGVVTGYFHMSRTLVAEGDTVARGQQIGLVGATGRVTGPHLHWSARYGALTVNPLDLIAIGGW